MEARSRSSVLSANASSGSKCGTCDRICSRLAAVNQEGGAVRHVGHLSASHALTCACGR